MSEPLSKRVCLTDPQIHRFDRHHFVALLYPLLDLGSLWSLYSMCAHFRGMLRDLPEIVLYREARANWCGRLHKVLKRRFKLRERVPLRCVQHVMEHEHFNEFKFYRYAAITSVECVCAYVASRSVHLERVTEHILQGALRSGSREHYAAICAVLDKGDVETWMMRQNEMLRSTAIKHGLPEVGIEIWSSSFTIFEWGAHFVRYAMRASNNTISLDYALARWPELTLETASAHLHSIHASCYDYPSLTALKWTLSLMQRHGRVPNFERIYVARMGHARKDWSWTKWLGPLAYRQFCARLALDPAAQPYAPHPESWYRTHRELDFNKYRFPGLSDEHHYATYHPINCAHYGV